MKKLVVLFAVALSMTSSVVWAEQQEEEVSPDTTVQIQMRNCSDPYVKLTEDCWTAGKTCPYPSYDTQARYCWSRSQGHFYRCGTVCKTPYVGGR